MTPISLVGTTTPGDGPRADPWWFWTQGPQAPAWNMACDATLLEWAPRLERPILRCYGWSEPAASIGYAQAYEAAAAMTHLRPIVRRPTGGGLVPHNADWTYSVVIPMNHPWFALSAKASYHRIHSWIKAAFDGLGVVTKLAPAREKSAPGLCFAGPEKDDLLRDGKKLAGAAQRRTKAGLLIQGSVQPDRIDVQRDAWEHAVIAQAEAVGITWCRFAPEPAFVGRVSFLTDEVFGRAEFATRR